jgi:hypothetical protein
MLLLGLNFTFLKFRTLPFDYFKFLSLQITYHLTLICWGLIRQRLWLVWPTSSLIVYLAGIHVCRAIVAWIGVLHPIHVDVSFTLALFTHHYLFSSLGFIRKTAITRKRVLILLVLCLVLHKLVQIRPVHILDIGLRVRGSSHRFLYIKIFILRNVDGTIISYLLGIL